MLLSLLLSSSLSSSHSHLHLPSFDLDVGNLLLGGDKEMADRVFEGGGLEDAAILSPIPLDDADDAAGGNQIRRVVGFV